MSAKDCNKKARRTRGMKARRGPAQSYKNEESNGKYARGKKRGLRKARRRLDKEVIKDVEEEHAHLP